MKHSVVLRYTQSVYASVLPGVMENELNEFKFVTTFCLQPQARFSHSRDWLIEGHFFAVCQFDVGRIFFVYSVAISHM